MMYRDNIPYNNSSIHSGSPWDRKISLDEPSSQNSDFSRPNCKSIYRQRKEFAELIQRQPGQFKHRVEHLLTCELDGWEVCSLDDCVTRLQLIDAKGQVWGQDVTLVVHDGSLQMIDIETKEVLETFTLGSITDSMAVLGRCNYNSLLMVAVQGCHQGVPMVFLFQCEDTGAEYVRIDLEWAVKQWRASMEVPHTMRHQGPESSQDTRYPTSQRDSSNYESLYTSIAEPSTVQPQATEKEPPQPVKYTEMERNVDILNHLVCDLEIFVGQVEVVLTKEQLKKNKVKNIMKRNKKSKDVKGMPSQEEYVSCLHKVKYGFNLLGQLSGVIENPSAQDFVHSFFSTLSFLVPHYPLELPPTVVSPLLTKQTIRLLSEEATVEEDQLWQSLGDAWNIPSSVWPDEVSPYTPEFTDGWKPSPVNESPQQQQNSGFQSSAQRRHRAAEASSQYMRVMYDFTGRNQKELSVLKGDVVQVLDQSKQWWKIRNDKNKEGYVPNNVLEPKEAEPEQIKALETGLSVQLNRRSKPEDVKIWLEDMGFSPVTVRCLSMLSGSVFLGMTREELKIMCPEEGGWVFSELQAIKAALV